MSTSTCCTSPQLNTKEIPVLLWTRLSGESPAALFMCERQSPERVWTQLCGHARAWKTSLKDQNWDRQQASPACQGVTVNSVQASSHLASAPSPAGRLWHGLSYTIITLPLQTCNVGADNEYECSGLHNKHTTDKYKFAWHLVNTSSKALVYCSVVKCSNLWPPHFGSQVCAGAQSDAGCAAIRPVKGPLQFTFGLINPTLCLHTFTNWVKE